MIDRRSAIPPTPRSFDSRELASFTHLSRVLQDDRRELWRDVLVWQRWIRYALAAIATLGAVALLGADAPLAAWIPIGTAGLLYCLFTTLIWGYLRRGRRGTLPGWIPGLVVMVDLLLIGALVYFSAPPAQYHRIFLLGFLVLQLAAFYFGRTLGFWAATAAVAAYVVASLLLPAHIPGPRPALFFVVSNALVFLFVSGVVILTFGDFRERMNKLRVFVKRVELGDLAGVYDDGGDRRPDDLTLLGRSFNEMRTRLIELIGTDPLTGCLNRRALESRLRREWRQVQRRESTMAVLAVDIDHFKQINDTYGHAAGDAVLHDLGEIMRVTARDTDTVARPGGDEFVILLPDTALQGAMIFAERLRRNVDTHVFDVGVQRLTVTISVGIAMGEGSDPRAAEELLEAADRTLYRAKSDGRNRICA